MAGQWGGILGTVVPAPGVARPTVTDWQIQVFFFGHTGHNGAGSCWGAGSGTCAGSCSVSPYAAGSVAPSTAALAGAICLDIGDKLCVCRREICCEPCDHSYELCNGGAVTRRGHFQVCDYVDRLLLEAPILRVCGGVVRGAVGGTRLILNRDAPLPVGVGKKKLRWGSVLSFAARFFHSQKSATKITVLKTI